MVSFKIREAAEEDAKAVHDIYGFYVGLGNVTFTCVNPSVEDYAEKIKRIRQKYPFFVAEGEDGEILGFVYGSPLRPHDAYRWNVESTIYISPNAGKRQGIGKALYLAFFKALEAQKLRYVYACIVSDNDESIVFHEALGFKYVGSFPDAGYKMGEWRSVVWYVKKLNANDGIPEEPIPCSEVRTK